ncbi:MAG: NUDIX hydrolase [Lachnospiraceae bacterium]|nr:NUDIX hydrolase [Lachnospiraceae bacterium]
MTGKIQDKDLIWEPVKTEHIIQDEWIDFRRLAYRLPDGTVFEPYYNYSRRDYVVIVASDTDGNYICVRQFRHGIGEVTTEFCAGGIERTDGKEYRSGECAGTREAAGDVGNAMDHAPGAAGNAPQNERLSDAAAEDALAAAKRELSEETGYVSDEWEHLLTVPSNATIADNYAYIYRAKNCRPVSGQKLDDTEFLQVKLYSKEAIEELIAAGRFQQAVHVMAWLLAQRAGVTDEKQH